MQKSMFMKCLTYRNITFALLAALGLGQATAAEKSLPDGVYAEMDTSKGKVLLHLEYEKVPLTVANFVGLAEGTKYYSRDGSEPKKQDKPFYDGLTFHRVIPDFMIQGGDPAGNGSGGPGYKFKDETRPELKHDKAGILSMANSDPQGSKKPYSNGGSSNGSQFFITHKETPWLDGMHTVFGHVVEGQDVVNKIVRGDTIKTVKILRVGDKAKKFKGDQAEFEKLSKAG